MSEFAIEVEGGSSVRLPTAGKYCDRDIVVRVADGGIQYDSHGRIYTENVIVPDTVTTLLAGIYDIHGIKSVYAPEVTSLGGHYCFGQTNNVMERIIAPKLQSWGGAHWCYNGIALKEVQAGSIGFPVVSMPNGIGFRCSKKDVVITIYVDANTIADIPSDITQYAPFGAVYATIVYRNSTTGEVITE